LPDNLLEQDQFNDVITSQINKDWVVGVEPATSANFFSDHTIHLEKVTMFILNDINP
jgi:hypothetical protein